MMRSAGKSFLNFLNLLVSVIIIYFKSHPSVCVWTLGFFGYFKQNEGLNLTMVVGKKDTRFQPYHFRRGSFSGNSDFYKNAHVDIYWLWIDRMYASVNFVLGLSSLYLGSNIQCHLDYLLQRGVNKASSAKRCELCERTALCNASERSANQAHEDKNTKKFGRLPIFWNIFLDHCQKILAHCQRTIWNFLFVGVISFLFLCYYCKQISRLKVRRLRRGSARIL